MHLERKTNHIHVDSKCAILFLLAQWPTFSETGQHTVKAKLSQHTVFVLHGFVGSSNVMCAHGESAFLLLENEVINCVF